MKKITIIFCVIGLLFSFILSAYTLSICEIFNHSVSRQLLYDIKYKNGNIKKCCASHYQLLKKSIIQQAFYSMECF